MDSCKVGPSKVSKPVETATYIRFHVRRLYQVCHEVPTKFATKSHAFGAKLCF